MPGWAGAFEASSQGRVRSLDRVIFSSDGRCWPVSGQVRTPRMGNRGYLVVSIGDSQRGWRNWPVHRLIALAFHGTRPPGMDVCHNNGDRVDNRAENLRYDTRSANILDAVGQGTHFSPNRDKTHCRQNHPLSGSNLYVPPGSNSRHCKQCQRDRQRERQRVISGFYDRRKL